MRPYIDVLRSASYSPRDYVEFVLTAAKRNVGPIQRAITGEASFGSPWLFALVVLGLFGTAWSRQRLLGDGLLVVYALMFVLLLLTVQALWFRYFYAILGMLLFWVAKGAEELRTWCEDTLRSLVDKDSIARFSGVTLKWLALAVVLFVSFRNISYVSQFEESLHRERKEAGLWLSHQEPTRKRIMDVGLQVAYYAGADLIYLPYADSDLALRYVAKRNPDYIVLIGGAQGGLPYTGKWFSDGIPSPRARLVYDEARPGGERVKIYQWSPPTSTD
jgi:hypothetical protein